MLHHPDDEKWLKEQLKKLPKKHRDAAMHGYDKAYREAYANEPLERLKEGEARRVANTRLRKYVTAINKNPPHTGGGQRNSMTNEDSLA